MSQSPDALPRPYPIIWKQSFTALNLSFGVGRYFLINNSIPIEAYVGIAPGVILTDFASIASTGSRFKNLNNSDSTKTAVDFPNLRKGRFFPLLELGFTIQPLPKVSQLKLGVMISAQAFNYTALHYEAVQNILSRKEIYNYDLLLKQRYFTSFITLGYSFYKIKKRVINYNLNPLDS